MKTIEGWLSDAERNVMAERERIERMKSITVTPEQIFLIIGMLTAIRVKCDSHNLDIRDNRQYPLNQSQISQFTELCSHASTKPTKSRCGTCTIRRPSSTRLTRWTYQPSFRRTGLWFSSFRSSSTYDMTPL